MAICTWIKKAKTIFLAVFAAMVGGTMFAEPLQQPIQNEIPSFLATPMDGSIQIIPVVMVQFLPTPDGKNLDTTKAPDFWWDNPKTIKQIREEINLFTHRSKFILEEGSRFRAYKNPGARPSLGYKVIASYTFYQHTPAGPYSWVNPDGIRAWFLDYEQIMAAINARHFVEDLGVREFWIWHGYFDGDFPCFKANPGGFRLEDARGLQESNMSSPTTGDISNSGRFNDLPIYRNTYIVYEYNLRRSHCEAIENHMHQLEVMLSHVYEVREGSSDFFWSIFVGGNSTQRIMGRCGWSHMPPNTIENYDWFNKTVVLSDIADWRPDGAGERQAVDFNTWMGREYNWPLSPAPAPDSSYWFIYWMQSMPGFTNGIPNGTKGIPNWWQFTADWDQTLTRDISAPVLLAGPQSQDVALGGTVELSALGTGHGLRYQWMLNGRNVLGGTNATLRLENVTYAAAGTYAVELVNLGGSVITTPVTLTVNGVSSAPTITTETLPKARCETPFTFSLQGSEGIPPYRWEWIGGHLPEGMSLSSDGTLSGIPAFAGTFVFVVQLTDLQTIKVTKELTLTVSEIRSRVRVAGRTIHTLALQTDGRLYAWGGNTEGQLGQGTTSNSSQPLAVGSDTDWIEVASGENHSMALKRDGTLWIWGGNNRGQLGNNSTARSTRPTRLGAAEWATIAAGAEYSLAVKTNGTLWAWGRNEVGQLGLGHTTDVRIPTQVGDAADWQFVAASAAASLGQRTNGTLWAWGDNYFGRLGNGSYSHTQVPVRMSAVQDWMDASLGYGHGAGIMSDGTVWTWGWNSSGQLGDGGHSDRNVPAEVEPSGSWKAIVAGAEHTLGIQVDGSLWAWGNNSNGKLGDGTLINRSVPTRIGSMTNWSALGLSIESSFAIQSDGSVWAWGLNSWGQLGDKTTVNRLQPVKILPLPAPPSISSIPEQYMVMNRTHSVSFSVRDTGTAADQLVIVPSCSNTILISADGLRIEGTGTNRTLNITPQPDRFGTCQLTLRATDTENMSSTRVFSLTVYGPPSITTEAILPSGRKGDAYQTMLQATGGLSQYSWILKQGSLPGGLALSTDGLLQGVPEESGSFSFVAGVVDSKGLASEKVFTLVLHDINHPPLLDLSELSIVEEGHDFSRLLLATDPDVPAQRLEFSLQDGPDSQASLTPEGLFKWTPGENHGPGTYIWNVRVTDDGDPSLSTVQPLQIVVREVNLPPMLQPVADQRVELGSTLSLMLRASDADEPKNHLSLSLLSGPADAELSPPTGLLAWTPKDPGTNRFSIQVSDDGTPPLQSTMSFVVVVVEPELPPTIVLSPTNQVVLVGGTVTWTAQADGSEPLLYEWLFEEAIVQAGPEASLVLTNVQLQHAGTYHVLVRNDKDQVVSAPFILDVHQQIQGVAVDGYIVNGTVFLDANRNGILNESEPRTQTDRKGRFSLTFDPAVYDLNHDGVINPAEGCWVLTGGFDLATGLPTHTPLTAPLDARVITPLTTLLQAMTDQVPPSALPEAQTILRAAFGLPDSINLLTFEPLAEAWSNQPAGPAVLAAGAQVQNTISTIAQIVADPASPGVMLQAASNLTAQLSTLVRMNTPVSLSQPQLVQSLLEHCASQFGASHNYATLETTVAIIGAGNQLLATAGGDGAEPGSAMEEVSRILGLLAGPVTKDLIQAWRNPEASVLLAKYSAEGLILLSKEAPVGDLTGDNQRPGTFSFSARTYQVAENGSFLVPITVYRHQGNNGAVDLRITLEDGSASFLNGDYLTNVIALSFQDGELSKTLDWHRVLNNDSAPESDETLSLKLSTMDGTPADVVLGTPSIATVTIVDDDRIFTPPRLEVVTQTDATLHLRIHANPGQQIVLQSSADLSTWDEASNLIMPGEFVDSQHAIPTSGSRFFRVKVVP